jgi:NTE family protein
MQNIMLILGGGGVRGLAHIGVLKALERLGMPISEYAGTSVGAIIAAMAAGGMETAEIERIGLAVRPTDLFDVDYAALLTHPARIKGLYKGDKLRQFLKRVIPASRFHELQKPLFIGAINMGSGESAVWGRDADIPLHDVLYASCAVPGLFPPQPIGPSVYIDGGSVEEMALRLSSVRSPDLIIAVKLGSLNPESGAEIQSGGILAILERFYEIKNRQLLDERRSGFSPTAPIVWIEPDVGNHRFFKVHRIQELISKGEHKALTVLTSIENKEGGCYAVSTMWRFDGGRTVLRS